MNKAELTERIIDPKRIAKADLPELKSLAEKYSFSPIFSLLLLSGLSQHDDFSFEEELSEHAYRIPDRIRLFHLTHDIQTSVEVSLEETPENEMVQETLETPVSLEEEVSNTELSKENETAEIQDEIVSTEEIAPSPTFDTEEISKTEVVEEKNLEPEEEENISSETSDTFEAFELDKSVEIETVEENDGLDEASEENQEQETPVIDFSSLENSQDEEQENEEVPEVEETIEVEATKESKSTAVDNLEVDMYAAAVSRSIELEVSENEIDSNTAQAEVNEVVEEITTSEKEEDQTEPASTNTTTNEKAEEEPKDFFAWLAAKKEEKEQPKIKEVVEATPTVPETIIDERKVKVETIETPQKPTDKTEIEEEIKEEKEGKSKVDSIIEKFISEEPQISRPKKEFFSPSKVAKKSLDESSLPVSETLAQIFAAQGNYPKAIASYEQLMLKFPEKKSFFANQIKKLKQKLIK